MGHKYHITCNGSWVWCEHILLSSLLLSSKRKSKSKSTSTRDVAVSLCACVFVAWIIMMLSLFCTKRHCIQLLLQENEMRVLLPPLHPLLLLMCLCWTQRPIWVSHVLPLFESSNRNAHTTIHTINDKNKRKNREREQWRWRWLLCSHSVCSAAFHSATIMYVYIYIK